MGRITEKGVEHLKPKERPDGTNTDGYLWDGEIKGFGVKATPGGRKVFLFQYRLGGRSGRTQRVTLGTHGGITLMQARKAASEVRAKVEMKTDPAAEVRQSKKARQEVKASGTFSQAVERFLAEKGHDTRYWKEKRARLTGPDVKGFAPKAMMTIERKDIRAVIKAVSARSEAAGRLLFSDIRPLFKWALDEEIIKSNPMAGMQGPKPIEARERTLQDFEIKAMWQATAQVSWPFASIYKLLLLTGARRDEVAGMRWAELDLDNALWIIPRERTKNGRTHRVALSAPAVSLLDRAAILAIKAHRGFKDSDLVFSTTGTTAPSGFSKAKRALDAAMKEILGGRFEEWRVHDLRRTCATGMEDLGIPTRVVETALNHISGTKAGIVGVYQRAEHKEAVKTAFEAWGRRVIKILGDAPPDSNIVPLRSPHVA
jgi:integrase